MRLPALQRFSVPLVVLLFASLVAVATGAQAAQPTCLGRRATIVGTGNGDELVGTNGPDVIYAGGGSDVVDGGGGNDLICGGSAPDTLKGGAGKDRLAGGKGNDILAGGPGRDRLSGDQGNSDSCDIGSETTLRFKGCEWFPIHFSGRVIHSNGTPAAGSRVTVTPTSGNPVGMMADAEGAFSGMLISFELPTVVRIEAGIDSGPDLPGVDLTRTFQALSNEMPSQELSAPDVAGALTPIVDGKAVTSDGKVMFEDIAPEIKVLFAEAFDPVTDAATFPGSFTENGTIPLDSSLFIWVQAYDADAQPVDELSQAMEVRGLVPKAQWSDLIDVEEGTDRIEVPIYFFDETNAVWHQEGTGWLETAAGTPIAEGQQGAILNGSFSSDVFATLSTQHLSWINVDYPYIGPWRLSKMSPEQRNTDCFSDAARVATAIVRSSRGQAAFSRVNVPGANVAVELADNSGPEIVTYDAWSDQSYGRYDGEAGGPEDVILIANRMWSYCGPGASPEVQRATTLLMAVSILHETAHWKDDVKKFPTGDNALLTGPGDTPGEEGDRVEEDLFGAPLFLNDNGTVSRSFPGGTLVGQAQIATWLDPGYWNSLRSVELAAAAPQLEINLTANVDAFVPGQSFVIDVEYENVSSTSVKVPGVIYLEDYPLRFDITHVPTGAHVGYRGTDIKTGIPSSEMVTLRPGEELVVPVDLVRDEDGAAARYNMSDEGPYEITAVFRRFAGVGATRSDPILVGGEVTEGAISGHVSDATTGDPLAGATVTGSRAGSPDVSVTTNDSGDYVLTSLAGGTYEVTAAKAGYYESSRAGVSVTTGITSGVNFSLSPEISGEGIRAVLTWGESPSDLDLHMWLPQSVPYHLYWLRRGDDDGIVDSCPFAFLDTDDVSSFGPETITIGQPFSGTYRYAVRRYSSTGALTTSGARVEVFDTDGLIRSFTVPTSGSGDWWYVFDLDGASGAVTPVDQLMAADRDGLPEVAPYPDTDEGCG